MHPKKFKAISEMQAPERYDYFIRKVCDFELVWGLHNEGWSTGMIDSTITIPVWPEREFAECNATGEWSGFSPREILLDEFINRWIPGAGTEEKKFAIFSTPNQRAIVVENERLLADLRSEISSYD